MVRRHAPARALLPEPAATSDRKPASVPASRIWTSRCSRLSSSLSGTAAVPQRMAEHVEHAAICSQFDRKHAGKQQLRSAVGHIARHCSQCAVCLAVYVLKFKMNDGPVSVARDVGSTERGRPVFVSRRSCRSNFNKQSVRTLTSNPTTRISAMCCYVRKISTKLLLS